MRLFVGMECYALVRPEYNRRLQAVVALRFY